MRYTFDDGTVADVFGELHFSTDGNTTVVSSFDINDCHIS